MTTSAASLQDYKLLLYQALGEPIGLLVQCSDFSNARQRFYQARNEAADPELAQLQFRASPGLAGGNLIIVKQRIQVPGPGEAASPELLLESESEL